MFYFEGIVNVKRIPKIHCAEFYETGKCSGKLPLDIVYCTLCRNYNALLLLILLKEQRIVIVSLIATYCLAIACYAILTSRLRTIFPILF